MSQSDAASTSGRGLTVAEIARRYRVSQDRVLGWIRKGELRAMNRRDCRAGRPSWVVLPEWLAEFERGRAVAAPDHKSAKRRKRANYIDFYPD